MDGKSGGKDAEGGADHRPIPEDFAQESAYGREDDQQAEAWEQCPMGREGKGECKRGAQQSGEEDVAAQEAITR
jgi:hypothetical protein